MHITQTSSMASIELKSLNSCAHFAANDPSICTEGFYGRGSFVEHFILDLGPQKQYFILYFCYLHSRLKRILQKQHLLVEFPRFVGRILRDLCQLAMFTSVTIPEYFPPPFNSVNCGIFDR